MMMFNLAGALLAIALILVSGCIGNMSRGTNDNPAAGDSMMDETDAATGESMAMPEGAEIAINDISVGKDLYHSNEIMKFNVTVTSDTAIDNARLNAAGIAEKMNIDRDVNITEGENVIGFEFHLPSCNTCGGIRAGTHQIDAGLYYMSELVAENSTTVEIRQ